MHFTLSFPQFFHCLGQHYGRAKDACHAHRSSSQRRNHVEKIGWRNKRLQWSCILRPKLTEIAMIALAPSENARSVIGEEGSTQITSRAYCLMQNHTEGNCRNKPGTKRMKYHLPAEIKTKSTIIAQIMNTAFFQRLPYFNPVPLGLQTRVPHSTLRTSGNFWQIFKSFPPGV